MHLIPLQEAQATLPLWNLPQGPYFMGADLSLVDINYCPFLERMSASLLYYKVRSLQREEGEEGGPGRCHRVRFVPWTRWLPRGSTSATPVAGQLSAVGLRPWRRGPRTSAPVLTTTATPMTSRRSSEVRAPVLPLRPSEVLVLPRHDAPCLPAILTLRDS